MKKNFVLFDGNPKFTFGGGQRVSIDILTALQGEYACYLVEVGETPVFFERAAPLVKGSARLSFPWKGSRLHEAVTFPLFWVLGFIRAVHFLKRTGMTAKDTILYSASKKSHLFLFFLKLFLGYKIVAHIQTMDDPRKFSTKVFRVILKYFDEVWGTSPLQKNIYPGVGLQSFPIAVHSIAEYPKTLSKNKIIVSSMSSLVPIKGIEDFISSWGHLKNPDRFEYWVIGDGPLKAELEDLAKGRVQFKGFIKDPAILLKDHVHVFVFPTLIPEAFGLSLLEAFAMGIPAVTTNIGHQQVLSLEFQNSAGVPPHSPKDIAAHIEEITQDAMGYTKASQHLLSIAQGYNFNAFANKVRSQLTRL